MPTCQMRASRGSTGTGNDRRRQRMAWSYRRTRPDLPIYRLDRRPGYGGCGQPYWSHRVVWKPSVTECHRGWMGLRLCRFSAYRSIFSYGSRSTNIPCRRSGCRQSRDGLQTVDGCHAPNVGPVVTFVSTQVFFPWFQICHFPVRWFHCTPHMMFSRFVASNRNASYSSNARVRGTDGIYPEIRVHLRAGVTALHLVGPQNVGEELRRIDGFRHQHGCSVDGWIGILDCLARGNRHTLSARMTFRLRTGAPVSQGVVRIANRNPASRWRCCRPAAILPAAPVCRTLWPGEGHGHADHTQPPQQSRKRKSWRASVET